MTRFIARRLALMLLTLLLVSVIVFALAEVVPGDVGRSILGRMASPQRVEALNHQLGYDRPLPVRFWHWISGFVTGRWGDSVVLRTPVFELVMSRFANSLQLAAIAMLLILPTSIAAGVLAGLNEGGLFDRVISLVSLALIAIPEFVSGAILLVVFAVTLSWFPVTAEIPSGAGLLDRLHALFLPSVVLGFVLFGYLARMARAGTISVSGSPFVRTAVLKGLPRRQIVSRHILREALLPTITVVGTQVGWFVGGLVVVETLFNYPGIGELMLSSAQTHDVPVLEATVLSLGAFYMLAILITDIAYGMMSPRTRLAA